MSSLPVTRTTGWNGFLFLYRRPALGGSSCIDLNALKVPSAIFIQEIILAHMLADNNVARAVEVYLEDKRLKFFQFKQGCETECEAAASLDVVGALEVSGCKTCRDDSEKPVIVRTIYIDTTTRRPIQTRHNIVEEHSPSWRRTRYMSSVSVEFVVLI